MAKNKVKKISPFWILQLLGFKGGSIRITRKGVEIVANDDKKVTIDSKSLINQCHISEGFIFATLEFGAKNRKVTFSGLPKVAAGKAYLWLKKHWYEEFSDEILQKAKHLKEELHGRYLRTSRWESINTEAKKSVNQFIEPPPEGLVSNDLRNAYIDIVKISKLTPKTLEAYRQKYIDSCKSKYEQYFENVESNPLTDNQRNACIIDEDNNLVLAGAGTGKTSTIIGRAGFLLKSGQAKESDILMLAFGRKAAQEMQERMRVKLGTEKISVSTFHKLGRDILASTENISPSISAFAEDEKLLASQIDEWIDELLIDRKYRKDILNYFQHYLYVEKNPFDFKSEGEYYEYLENNEIRTFRGEKVKGHGERIIANFLFMMGIEYQYEPKYEYETRDLNFRQYYPDFYLPEYKIYIEHFGISKDGGTAPYVDQDSYHKSMEWKRELHKEKETILIETYHYEHFEGGLEENLEKKLIQHDVKFEPIPKEAVLETLREFGEISKFAELMGDLLNQYKTNWFDQSLLNKRIGDSPYKKYIKVALGLLTPILDNYETVLEENEEIDFNDMIGRALGHVEAGRFVPKWKFIMVDEFQDISDPRARLVNLLKNKSPGCSLFCVGDDWQAIYRFTGSDINFTTGFTDFFGPTAKTILGQTFRFNDSIVNVSSSFVTSNPHQTKKRITTEKKVSSPAVSILRQRLTQSEEKWDRVFRVMARIAQLKEDASVLILGRYRHLLPEAQAMGNLVNRFPNLKILCHTMHGAKGKEADYVVCVGMESGKWGFPSEIITNPLLDALLPNMEDFAFAEERRLFYVALTRARERVYLITDMTVTSKFILELIEGDYLVELNEFDVSESQKTRRKIRCIICTTGTLQPRSSKYGEFFGCSHYPLCKHVEHGCEKCGLEMWRPEKTNNTRRGGYKVCIDENCSSWVPLCPECGAVMVQRTNKRDGGKFWGCKNWRPGNQRSCGYTENQIDSPLIVEISDKGLYH